MPVNVRFTSNSSTNGMTVRAFQRSHYGAGLFFHDVGQGTVAADHFVFPSLATPDDYAFTVESPAGTRFRSGRQVLASPTTDTFLIVQAPPGVVTPAQLASMLPPLPKTVQGITIATLSLVVGAGIVTASGTGSQSTAFGPVPISFTYVFTLDPSVVPADMGYPNTVPPAIDVRTISLTVVPMQGGFGGFIVNGLLGALYSILLGSLIAAIENLVQSLIDGTVATKLGNAGAPLGTIATVESLSIAPVAGLTFTAFGGLSMEKLCPVSASGGSVKVRALDQLTHLRAIRDGLLARSPQGQGYIALYETFGPELSRIVIDDPELLGLIDRVVSRIVEGFPIEDPGRGVLSEELAKDVDDVAERIRLAASPKLATTVAALRAELRAFVGRPAGDVLQESFGMIDRHGRPVPRDPA
jgi:hypothetical protein